MSSTFNIVFICTGNRCRSPYGELYMARLTQELPVTVSSVGTLDVPGKEVPAELIEIGAGLNLAEHRSRPLIHEDLSEVDLALGFERNHVAAAVVDGDIPYDKVYTLPEIVRLVGEVAPSASTDPVERAREMVARAAAHRGPNPTFMPGEEVADPFRKSMDVYRASAEEIGELCRSLFEGLFGRRADVPTT